jgi:hypothetical protein
MHVFVRGVKLEFKNFECIKRMIDIINNNEPVKVKYLIAALDKEWDQQVGLYILNMLYVNHAIRIVHY